MWRQTSYDRVRGKDGNFNEDRCPMLSQGQEKVNCGVLADLFIKVPHGVHTVITRVPRECSQLIPKMTNACIQTGHTRLCLCAYCVFFTSEDHNLCPEYFHILSAWKKKTEFFCVREQMCNFLMLQFVPNYTIHCPVIRLAIAVRGHLISQTPHLRLKLIVVL